MTWQLKGRMAVLHGGSHANGRAEDRMDMAMGKADIPKHAKV